MRALALTLLLAAPASAADPVEAEMSGVVDLFYGLRFAEARAAAAAAQARHPGHPAPAFYASVVAFQELLAGLGVSTAPLAAFDAEALKAAAAAEAWGSTSPATSEYYQGAVHGFAARADFATKGPMAAAGSARRAVKHLKRAMELDPSREDGYLGLGMYEYYVGQAPFYARPFAFALIGVWGNESKGLAHLERASRSEGPARMEARSALSAIYASDRQRRWDDAEALLKELVERYPGNPLYRLRRAYVALRRGAWGEAKAAADPDGPWLEQVPAPLRSRAKAAALYRAAEAELMAGRFDEAAVLLSRLEGLELPPGLAEWAKRRKGETLFNKPPPPEFWPQDWPPTGVPD
ncbi:hypothetical protein EPO15_11510 [bacterium]|nr:MAG: hypothetical protein EPO15_11510 [bacterium]